MSKFVVLQKENDSVKCVFGPYDTNVINVTAAIDKCLKAMPGYNYTWTDYREEIPVEFKPGQLVTRSWRDIVYIVHGKNPDGTYSVSCIGTIKDKQYIPSYNFTYHSVNKTENLFPLTKKDITNFTGTTLPD